jgi:hypothetical protein
MLRTAWSKQDRPGLTNGVCVSIITAKLSITVRTVSNNLEMFTPEICRSDAETQKRVSNARLSTDWVCPFIWK